VRITLFQLLISSAQLLQIPGLTNSEGFLDFIRESKDIPDFNQKTGTFMRGIRRLSTTLVNPTPQSLDTPAEHISVIEKHWLESVLDEADPGAFEWSWIKAGEPVTMQVASFEALEEKNAAFTHTYKCVVACIGSTWEMHKRYSQFEKLWTDLEKADNDGCSDLSRPGKSLITLGILDAEGLKQRRKDLDKFARAVVSRVELLNKEAQAVVWHFLGVHRIFQDETKSKEVLDAIHQGDHRLEKRKSSMQGFQAEAMAAAAAEQLAGADVECTSGQIREQPRSEHMNEDSDKQRNSFSFSTLDQADPGAFEWSWIKAGEPVTMQVASFEALEDAATNTNTHVYKCVVACIGSTWEMHKRYSQFEKLWTDLEKADNDGCSDLSRPGKSLITLGILDAEGLKQRRKDLDKFARAVMSRVELLNKEAQAVVWHFLGVHRIFQDETGARRILEALEVEGKQQNDSDSESERRGSAEVLASEIGELARRASAWFGSSVSLEDTCSN
jgi:hypothetical protein